LHPWISTSRLSSMESCLNEYVAPGKLVNLSSLKVNITNHRKSRAGRFLRIVRSAGQPPSKNKFLKKLGSTEKSYFHSSITWNGKTSQDPLHFLRLKIASLMQNSCRRRLDDLPSNLSERELDRSPYLPLITQGTGILSRRTFVRECCKTQHIRR